MRPRLRRAVVLVAGITGLLALLGEAAQAYSGHQHCEPLVAQ
ncbi:hypothetical protein [Virgisporangium aliadipatigenens]|nr:hypothetical protein [Virgisporangium aliadipatigenens]